MGGSGLYIIVDELPGMDDMGILLNIDRDSDTIDTLCYRVKPDGSIHGWVKKAGETRNAIFHVTPGFTPEGVVESITFAFHSRCVRFHSRSAPGEHYYPSDETE